MRLCFEFTYERNSYIGQFRLATLDAFLDSQRQLIARTQADIQKLTLLRERALKDPVSFVENAEDEVCSPLLPNFSASDPVYSLTTLRSK